jgi:hypothetical protein
LAAGAGPPSLLYNHVTSFFVGDVQIFWPGCRGSAFSLSLSLSHACVGSQAFCWFVLLCFELLL